MKRQEAAFNTRENLQTGELFRNKQNAWWKEETQRKKEAFERKKASQLEPWRKIQIF